MQMLVARDFEMPTDAELPNPVHREVARVYVERRDFSVAEVLDAVSVFAQPHLLETSPENVTASLFETAQGSSTVTALGPSPRTI